MRLTLERQHEAVHIVACTGTGDVVPIDGAPV